MIEKEELEIYEEQKSEASAQAIAGKGDSS